MVMQCVEGTWTRGGEGGGKGYAQTLARPLNYFIHLVSYTGYSQKNGAVSKVNSKSISHLTRVNRTPSAAATVQVSHVLLAVRVSCLLRGRGAPQ
jgi:hypothetical protein